MYSAASKTANTTIGNLPNYGLQRDGSSSDISHAQGQFASTVSEREALARRLADLELEMYGRNEPCTLRDALPLYKAQPHDLSEPTVHDVSAFPQDPHSKYPSEKPRPRKVMRHRGPYHNIQDINVSQSELYGQQPAWRKSVTVPQAFSFHLSQKPSWEVVQEYTLGKLNYATDPKPLKYQSDRMVYSGTRSSVSVPTGQQIPGTMKKTKPLVSLEEQKTSTSIHKKKLREYIQNVLAREKNEVKNKFKAKPLPSSTHEIIVSTDENTRKKVNSTSEYWRIQEEQRLVRVEKLKQSNQTKIQPFEFSIAGTTQFKQEAHIKMCNTDHATCHVGCVHWTDENQYRSHSHAPFGSTQGSCCEELKLERPITAERQSKLGEVPAFITEKKLKKMEKDKQMREKERKIEAKERAKSAKMPGNMEEREKERQRRKARKEQQAALIDIL